MQVIITEEVRHFLLSVEKTAYAKIEKQIELLRIFGYMIRMPYSRFVLPGIFELRIIGKTNLRLMYTFHSGSAIVFCAFVKKTNEISEKDMHRIKIKFRDLQL